MAGKPERKPEEQGLEELNLVEFPLGLLCDKRSDEQQTIEFSDTVTDQQSGEQVIRRVIVTGADKWGLPTWQDIDVLLALMKLTNDRHRFTSRKLQFSLYELRKELQWPNDGRYKNRLREAILRLLGMTVAYDNAWRSNGKWKSVEAFHLLDNIALTNTRDFFDPDEEQHLKWNDVVVDSIQATNTKGIDWEFYLSLKLPTTKRLYRFLDKRFNLRPEWNWEVSEFCQEKLGMSRSAPVWENKRQLSKAIEELEKKGFLPTGKTRFEKAGKGVHRVSFVAIEGGRDSSSVSNQTSEPKARDAEQPLVAELLRRGITNAKTLVANQSAELIEQQIENYDDRVKHGEQLTPGWLRKAIETSGGFGFRKGYKSKAEQAEAAKRSADVQARRKLELAAAEAKKRESEEREESAFIEFMAAFSNEERAAFEALALQTNKLCRDQYQKAELVGDSERMALYLKSALQAAWKKRCHAAKTTKAANAARIQANMGF